MGTRADFYVGRGINADWLGSVAFDGYPEGIDKQLLHCMSEAAFRHAFKQFTEARDDATLPEQGWPWPWENSEGTDFAYAFDEGGVWISCCGCEWFDAKRKLTQEELDALPDKIALFPDMSDQQRVTFGPRSGLLIISRQ